jgi:hypothetical protein
MRQGAAPGRGRPEYEARQHVLGAGAVARPVATGGRMAGRRTKGTGGARSQPRPASALGSRICDCPF